MLVFSGLAGCQGRGDVSGSVSHSGKTVWTGSVLAVGLDGIVKSSPIVDGTFMIRDLPTGDVKFLVNSPDPGTIVVMARKKENLPPPQDRSRWFPVPAKYGDFATSGLTFQVKKGPNQLSIDLP